MLYALLAPLLLLPAFWWDRRRKQGWVERVREERLGLEAVLAQAEASMAQDLLAQLTRELALSQDVKATAETALNCLASWIQAHHLALYDVTLQPICWRGTPDAPPIPAVIEQELAVWQSWFKLRGGEQPLTGHIQRGAVMVWPLEREGVLLLDLTDRMPLNEEQHLLVTLVASMTALGLQSAGRLAVQQETQERMLRASKLAAIGQLAAGVAHELNTPLGAAMLQLDLLQMHPLAPESLTALEKAQSAVEHAQKTIERLLLYSRKSNDFQEVADINDLLRETLALLQPQFQVEDVSVTTEWAANTTALINAGELQQVFTYLLLYARQGGSLLVRSRRPSDEIVVEVLHGVDDARSSDGFELDAVRSLLERNGCRLELAGAAAPWKSVCRVRLPLTTSN